LLEGGGFSNVAVEQDEVTFEFDSPEPCGASGL
jgi:hypothetical protein